jgi:hypothetical protein
MKHRIIVGVPLAAALIAGCALAANNLKSGPQEGSTRITPFNPLHVTGDTAGEKTCLV